MRFEGELTLVELADHIGNRTDWRATAGIVYQPEEGARSLRPGRVISCAISMTCLGRCASSSPNRCSAIAPCRFWPAAGCARTCSFCSIHTFYCTAPGKVVRTRNPARVVEEMRWLWKARGISIFLFQDHDFPLFGPVWQRWTRNFLDELHHAGLPGRVIWKINCRADAVDEQLFKEMKAAGLYLVYMGLELGDEQGLKTLNKGITVEQNFWPQSPRSSA